MRIVPNAWLGTALPAILWVGSVALLFTPSLPSQGPVQVHDAGPATVGTDVWKQVPAKVRIDISPPPRALMAAPLHGGVPIPVGNGTLPQPMNPPCADGVAGLSPTGFGAFTFFVNRPVTPAGALRSVVAEPSCAMTRDTAFVTGNHYAAVSADSGMTWTHVDPATLFPASDGGFCCDQRTIYVPNHDITLWLLQYVPGSNGNNRFRVAVCRGRTNLLNSNASPSPWYFYDFTPQNMGQPNDRNFDFPDIAVTAGFLHVSANVFDNANPAQLLRAIRWSINLADLAAGVAAPRWGFHANVPGRSFRFTQGALRTTMFFASIESTTGLRIFVFDEVSTILTHAVHTISAINPGVASAPGPDHRDWAGRAIGRIRGAFATPSQIGFLVPSNANGTTRPFAYTRVARFRHDLTPIGESDLWSPTMAYLYAAAYGNDNEDVAGVVAAGGPTQFPHVRAFLADIYDSWPPATFPIAIGSHGPDQNRWGDYYSLQPHPTALRTFIATGARQLGGTSGQFNEPRFVWFGRNDFEPRWVRLNVESSPITGLAITQRETDLDGANSGSTSYRRRLPPRARCTLTAPQNSVVAGVQYEFDRWAYRTTVSGAFSYTSNRVLALDDVGVEECTARAQYLERRDLYVFSTNPTAGVAIDVSAFDITGARHGTTQFTRAYKDGTTIDLVAPALVNSNPFKRWRLNGVDQPVGQRSVRVLMNGTMTAIADYYVHHAGNVTGFGSSCAGVFGLGVHTVAGRPEIGQVVEGRLSRGLPNLPAVLTVGVSNMLWNGSPLPFAVGGAPGCFIYVAPSVQLSTTTDAVGSARVAFALPTSTSAIGRHQFTQYWCYEPQTNVLGWTFSNGVDILIGGNR